VQIVSKKTSIRSREEIWRLLENIHPSTLQSAIAVVVCGISDTHNLSEALKYSYRNAVRLLKLLSWCRR